ncbi:hypothetical protein PGT2_g00037 [Escherichia phage PGT2]|uniref:Internal virion protein n=1 Tax=Escherichia phage PGT2 TaxID=2047782 RepID=A0A2D2W2T5_9CAUD|nr:hypothetical protein HOS43_gp37 [Escherichia phage PGT2]ATS92455.1 hypothetical protein PGT2_g00037 [Escherichia phage PGT2]
MGSTGGGALGGAAGGAAAGYSVGGPWGAAIGGALGLVSGLFSGNKEKAQARIANAQQQAQYIVQNAQAQAQTMLSQNSAAAQNLVASGNNFLAAANESVALYTQSLNNQRSYKATGEAYNALQESIGRYSDDYLRGTFQQRLQASEMLGRTTAEFAAAGVGGSTSQLVNRTMRLQAGVAEEEMRIGNRSAMWDFAKQRGALTDQAVDGTQMLVQRDMTGYDPSAGFYFGNTTIGPQAPVGTQNLNSWSNTLGSVLGSGMSAYNTVQGMSALSKLK